MWNNRLLRVLGLFIALAALTTACGSDTPDTQSADTPTDDAGDHDDMGDMDDHAGDHDDMDDMDDHGATIDVDPDLPIPEVAMILNETESPGVFDLKVILANFTVTEENVDGDPIDNEGHMHLLIDGDKVERFYALERQITVPEGEHLVEIELNSNDHSAYSIDGVPIRTGMTVVGAGEATHDDDGGHDHSAGGAAIEEGLAAADADVTITATFKAGTVDLEGDDRVDVEVDDVVMVMVTSDVTDQVHVHGYNILAEVGSDMNAMILFTADSPGKFEIEFEASGTFIAELVVS